MDMIKALSPWVQLIDTGTLGVTFKTEEPAYGRVYWRQKANEPWRMSVGKARDGLLPANTLLHQVPIEGFEPNLPLELKAACLPIEKFGAYEVAFGLEKQGEPVSLRPLLNSSGALSLAMVCDLHNQGEKLLTCLGETAKDISLCVLNGDTCDAPNGREDLERNLAGVLRQLTQLGIIALYVRGNHEWRGAGARSMPEYLIRPKDRYYGALTIGACRLVFLDTGEDKPKDHEEYSGLIDFQEYLEEEALWLRQEVAGKAFKEAAYRIVFMHIPPRPFPGVKPYPVTENGWNIFAPIIRGQKVGLVLSGHEHVPNFVTEQEMREKYSLDFPLVIGGGGWHHPERLKAIKVEVNSEKIEVFEHNLLIYPQK